MRIPVLDALYVGLYEMCRMALDLLKEFEVAVTKTRDFMPWKTPMASLRTLLGTELELLSPSTMYPLLQQSRGGELE